MITPERRLRAIEAKLQPAGIQIELQATFTSSLLCVLSHKQVYLKRFEVFQNLARQIGVRVALTWPHQFATTFNLYVRSVDLGDFRRWAIMPCTMCQDYITQNRSNVLSNPGVDPVR